MAQTERSHGLPSRAILAASALLLATGAGFRVAPLFDHGDRLLWQWPTEDGYLMMTIARNLALGRGMSISAGEVETNGTQPLTTFVWAGLFRLAGGDRRAGVLLVQVWQILVAAGAAWLVREVGSRALRERPWGRDAATLGAAAWFASPVAVDRTMNGLETGTYVFLLLAAALLWLRWQEDPARRFRPGAAAAVGALLGLTFLARIDAVFFIAALTGAHALLARDRGALPARLAESTVMGLASIAIASPWLLYGLLRFGSVMPVSGTAQSAAATVGGNLAGLPGALFEYAALVIPVPARIEGSWPVFAATTVCVLAYAAALVLAAVRGSRMERSALALAGATSAALAAYYGVFFGASHFLGRYLFPVSPFFALASASFLLALASRMPGGAPAGRRILGAALAAAVLLAAGLNARVYAAGGRGSAVDHRAVLRWVQANVPPEAWVGAVQTGVLGFFHDRTINLDGKVNPEALSARLERRIPAYVVDLPIAYIADWAGLASWIELEPIDRHFELVVHDREANLAVLRRVTPLPDVQDVARVAGGRPRG